MKLVLEARHLFDGSLHAVAKHATDVADHTHHPADSHAAPSHSDPAPAPHAAAVSYADVPALAPNPTASEILFVDTRVANWQSLASSVKSDVQVVLIDPAKDGVDQVTAALQGRSGLTSIQFLTYGQPGQLELGSGTVTADSLSSHAADVASWGDHLAAGGDIEFWGCNVGQGSAGQAFVDTVHTLTGATVGASTDSTGAATLGGNWVLEDTTGPLHGAVFSDAAMADYQGVLDSAVASVTLTPGTGSLTGGTTGDVLLGDTFTETVTFTNGTAGTQAGFGPIIEVFVPTAGTDAEIATLSSATYLGSAVSQHAVVLTSSDPLHPGVVGGYDPFVHDANGNATWIAAPAGFKAGDTMYDLVLPFGSFTKGQPTVDITLNFALSPSSELTNHGGAHPGSTLNIAATGVFEFGNDALDNPGTDAPIFGATVSSSTTVSLVNIQAVTDLHEDETATGPDNPFDYVITVTPAPVVSSNHISGGTLTFTLPGQVDYTGGTISITDSSGTVAGDSASFGGTLNTPGGTITVSLPTLTHATTIKIPVYVPEKDSTGTTILTAANHYQQQIDANPNSLHFAGQWTPTSGNAVPDGVETFNDPGTATVSFTAKALAIQVTDSLAGSSIGLIPGGSDVTETINFQVSDYVALTNLVIKDVLGDGFTLDPSFTPTFQVNNPTVANNTINTDFGAATNQTTDTPNGQTVALSGSAKDGGNNTLWNYQRNDTAGDGTTAIDFMIGALLADSSVAALQGHVGAGTSGTITFKVKALDKYTETNGNQSLREGDFATNAVTTAGTSANVTATSDSGTTTDDSTLTDTVAPNTLTLTIVDVNGVAWDGVTPIQPGDTVTYEMTYTLTDGADYGNLSLTSFLPEPVFSTTDPTANGSDALFTSGTGLIAGTYKLVSGPTGITAVGTNGAANNITFSLGTNDDTANVAGQKIVIDFSVKATNVPFADGLFLTNQANSQNFDAHNAVTAITANAIQETTLAQPELETKTGVVSVVGDTGTVKGSYGADTSNSSATWTSQSGNPNTQFAPAGTPVGNPFGTGNPQSSDDMNVTGADGGDLARIVSTVENTGHATAFDVTVNGTLPGGYSAANVTNFAVYDASGNQLAYSGSIANYFSSTGITLTNGVAAGEAVYVVYDLRLSATQAVGNTLAVASSVVNWANFAGGVAAGDGFVTAGTPVGEIAADLADNATIAINAPTLVKTITGASDTTDVPLGPNHDVVLGETVDYQVVVSLPEGSTVNTAGDLVIKDVLPSGMSFVNGSGTVTYGSGVTGGGTATFTVNGGVLTIDLGTSSLTNGLQDQLGTITITYQLKVTDATPDAGTTHTNSATFLYNANTSTSPSSVTVTEVDPNVAETITVKDGGTTIPDGTGKVFDGENLTYTVTLTNNGNAQADQLVYYVEVPNADLGNITAVTSTIPGAQIAIAGTQPIAGMTLVEITVPTLAAGASDTFSFTATVNQNLPASTPIVVDTPTGNALTSGGAPNGTYNSLPDNTGHVYAGTASSTVSLDTITPTLTIIGEANNTNGGGTGLYGTAVTSVDATVGDIVRYSATAQLPEGQQNDLLLTVNLPDGMKFQNDGSITIELVSPDGSISATIGGSSVDGTGVSYTGTFNPNTAKATFTLSASQITVNADGTVTFDLGKVVDNAGSGQPDFAIVQFNAIVTNQTSNVDHASLVATAAIGNEAGEGPHSTNATVTVEEPHVTVTKGVTSIVTVGGVTTVTYTETVDNTGDATAYNVSLDDPDAGSGVVGAIGNATITSGSGLAITSGNGTHDFQASGSLGAGQHETFTYTQTIIDPTNGVADTTATVTYTSLSNATTGGEALAGTQTGASGSLTGSRDGTTAPTSLNNYKAQETLGLGVVKGNIWNDEGSPLNAASQGKDSSADTELGGVTVSGAWTGGNSSVVTDGNGDFFILLPDAPGLGQNISTPTTTTTTIGGETVPETLVYDTTNSATFHHTETGLSSGNSTLSVTPNASTPVTGYNFAYRQPDTAPTLGTWGNTSPTGTVPVYTIGGAPVGLGTGSSSVADTELATLIGAGIGDYSGTVLTVVRDGGANGNDVFAGDGTAGSGLFLSGGTVTFDGTAIGSYTETNGTLAVKFGAGTNAATVQEVLDHLTYANTGSATQLTGGILIDATLTDHNTETGSTAGNAYQGTGGVQTSNTVQVLVDLAPTPVVGTFTDPNDTSAPSAAVTLAPGVALTDTVDLTQIELSITVGLHAGEDRFVFAPGSDVGDISAQISNTFGTLTLTSASGTATLAQWQAALRSVQYYDNSDTPTTGQRTISFVTTGVDGSTISGTLAKITVVAANDSPILSVMVPDSFPTGTENSGTAPVDGTVGTLVSSLIGGHVIDPDDAGVHDGGTPGLLGIAITQADTSAGTWWYSTDGGHHWTEFAGNGTTETALDGTNSLHLVGDANTMIYFAPAAGANGQVDTALTYRAWDQYFNAGTGSASANGSVSALPTDSAFGTGSNTNASAYSANQQVLSLAITANQTVTYTDPNTGSAGTNPANSAIPVDGGLVLTTTDAITSATITLSGGNAEDTLNFANDGLTMGNITGSYVNGVMTLSSVGNSATAAQFQAAIDAVKFYDTSDTPVTGDRTATIAVVDGTTATTRSLATVTVTVDAGNDSPVLNGHPVTLDPATENQLGAPTSGTVGTQISSLIGGGNVTDTDGTNDTHGQTPGALGIAVTAADTTEGNWWFSLDGGATWTEFAGTGTTETALNGANALHLASNVVGGVDQTQIYFQPTVTNANGVIANALTFRGWDQFDSIADHTVFSGAVTNLPTDTALGTGTNSQASAYSSASQTLPIVITSTGAATYTEVNGVDSGSAAITVDPTAVLTATSDTFTSATISISNFQPEDHLGFVNGNGVTGSYDSATGVLTLTAGSGVSAATMQAAIDSVTYFDGSDTPVTTTRNVTISAHDSTAGADVAVATTTISITPTNDTPVLDSSVSVSLNHATEDAGVPVDGTAVGTLISQLVGGISDTDANGVHDGSTPATVGIAITGADTSEGSWYYSTDGGAHWTLFASAGSGLPSGDALHLVADANTRIYFDPTANWNGTVPNALTFRAWDQFDHSIDNTIVNGSISALPTGLGSGTNTAGSAYSSAVKSIDLVADAVNDAPVASGTATVGATEDTTPPGDTVAHLFGGNFNDGTDQQQTGGNPTGSVANTLAGVAIIGNAATADQGVWQYSTDGGTTWTTVSASVSDTNALVLSQSAELRFVPDANFNGVPGGLTTRLIDSSTETVTTGVTGASLVGDTAAHAGVDVSGTKDGGTTAVSAGTVVLDTSVVAVNDAPTVSGSVTVPSTPEDSNSAGTSVGTLLGQTTVHYDDSTDTVTTAVSGGSTGTPAAAIAITGNAATPDQGTWQYSTDNGAHWISIPTTGLSDTNAVVIPGSAELRFMPAPNWNGVPGELTAHVSDGTNLPPAGTTDISTTEGGTGGWSTGTITLGTSVVAVNDAPVVDGSAAIPPATEDGTPAGTGIGSLLGQPTVHYTDGTDTVPDGSTGTPAAAIAITGNAATPDQGTWQYSTDNGTTWVSIPATGLSDSNAIVIPVSAELRFVPAGNYNGVVGSLTAHVSDGTDLPPTGPQDISATEGGTGGWSAGTITVGTSVIAVNDAPVASGSATLPGVSQNDLHIPGDTVGDLFGGNFNDGADHQQTAGNPTGSTADNLAGIAITGNAAAGQGTWEYSSDGVNWTAVPTNVSGTNAIILSASDSIRFVPNQTFIGTPGALTVHLIDSSSGPLTGISTGVDVSNVGGTTVYSAAPVLLTTQVEGGGRAILTPPANPILTGPGNSNGDPIVDKPSPGDFGLTGGNHGATTDDFLQRPIIPQVSLIGSVGNKFVIAEQQAIIAVPENLFEDSYPGAQLEYSARNPAGGSLPAWLEFDARNLTFSGTPPASAHGAVDILLVARDQFGNEATASFRILVGRESEDLQHLMEPNSPPPTDDGLAIRPVPASNRNQGAPGHRTAPANGTAPGRRTHAEILPHDRHADLGHAHGGTVEGMFASLAQPANGVRHGHSAFSAQLREAGPIGRLSQARQLLETIAKTVSSKPAA